MYPRRMTISKAYLTHTAPEDRALQLDPTSTSHTNSYEVETKVALVQHRPSNDQQAIFAEECVYLATVDNFQGEEAKVALGMKQRGERDVGSLSTPNRINVPLFKSEARSCTS
ncbi:hypothetical protein PG997_010450 [Apiospora hydei]|uniref:Uncharacterized protein n=1 Tax=Apiospora hydei TaxID=1337664 RepID=A0ABR1VY66_9PEZI